MREYQKHLSGHVNFIADQKVIRRLPQTSDSIAPNADLFLTPHHPLQPADLGLFGFPLLSPASTPTWPVAFGDDFPFLSSPDHVAPTLTWAGAFPNLSS